jgi:inosine-uridine nucleoside N-ribohydrolase
MAMRTTDGNTIASKSRAVLDTDTYDEIDDQFALAYLLRASDVAEPEAICAAPFSKRSATSPADGMEKSFAEIERLLPRLEQKEFPHFRGSDRLLGPAHEPVQSDAVTDLVARGMSATPAEPLTIVAIAALTNVARRRAWSSTPGCRSR